MKDFQINFDAIGTKWFINCLNTESKKEDIEKLLKTRIGIFDKTYSRFRKDSLVWEISQKKGEYIFPDDAGLLFDNYKKFGSITNGLLTPLVGSILDESGYDAGYSFKEKKINELPNESEVYFWHPPKLLVKKPHILDFGALGKGYLIDIVSKLLKDNGIDSYFINAGGDIKCENLEKPLRIGLENPNNIKQVLGVVELNNKSICSSAGNRRTWGKYHHIFNPKTLKPSNEILATWVVANDTITADGLSTALFLEKPKKLLKYFDFEYFILFPDFRFDKSKKFSAELFLK